MFRAGLEEFGLLLDTYNIALLVSDLQTIFSCLFRLPQYHPATNPQRKPGVASDLFLLPNVTSSDIYDSGNCIVRPRIKGSQRA